MIEILKAILLTDALGTLFQLVIMLAVLCVILSRKNRKENAEIRKALTHFPPDETKRAKEELETAEAWRRMQDYSAADAYGGDSG